MVLHIDEKQTYILYFIFFAFLIRLIVCVLLFAKMDLDPQWYYDTALKVAAEKSFNVVSIKPSFYPIFLSFIFSIFKESIFVLQLVQCIIDCLTVFLCIYFVKTF